MYSNFIELLADVITMPQVYIPCILMEILLAGCLIYVILQPTAKTEHTKKSEAINYQELIKIIDDNEIIETLKKI